MSEFNGDWFFLGLLAGMTFGAAVSETAFNIPEIIRRSTWKTPELRESAAKLVQVIIEEHAK